MDQWDIYRSEMRILEVFHVAKSFYEPIVEIACSQGCLNGLQ